MLVDYEAAWIELRASLPEKSGHGTFGPDGLLARMARLESDHILVEGTTEKVLRLFGVEVSSELLHNPSAEQTSVGEPSGTPSSQGSHNSIGAEE